MVSAPSTCGPKRDSGRASCSSRNRTFAHVVECFTSGGTPVCCIQITSNTEPPFNSTQTFTHYEDNLERSIWLTMMRDRLVHLKKLLADDGSIWVHLDEVEIHRMRLLMDEIFGATNFLAEVG